MHSLRFGSVIVPAPFINRSNRLFVPADYEGDFGLLTSYGYAVFQNAQFETLEPNPHRGAAHE